MALAQGRVVVGVDGSLASLAALRQAVATARLMQLPLQAVLVWGPEVASYNTVDFSVNDGRLLEGGRRRIDEAFARALGGQPTDIEVSTQVRASEGNAGRVLTWLADRDDDLLVIGSSQRRWLSGLRPSSVGRYCLRHAQCPVLVVPLTEFAKAVTGSPLYAKRLVRFISTG